MQITLPVASVRDPQLRYRVVLDDQGDECECPDFFYRRIVTGNDEHRCKHIRHARELLVTGIPAPRRSRRTPSEAPATN